MGGGVAALLNLSLIYGLITPLGWDTPLLRNLANLVAIELSLIASFFIYRIWVWPGGSWSPKRLLLEQLPLYHFSAGAALLLRVLVIFPVLDRLGVNYLLNTLLGVAVGATINYILSDRLVFNRPAARSSQSLSGSRSSVIYRPEGLAPASVETTRTAGVAPTPLGASIHDQLSIVMPAYNEEGSIVSTVEAIVEVLSAERIAYEILVVNDNSRDRTESLLQELSDRYQSVRYLNNYYPNGFGFAVRCGLENFEGDAVAIVMADCSDRPEDIVRYFYKLQEGYDCVFGSRFMKGGKVIDYPAHK
ncbi:MAG: glycosyltransferase, partial [Cyanobacteria bacterium P01_E01_bin.43]